MASFSIGLARGSLGIAVLAAATLLAFGGWQLQRSRQAAIAGAQLEVANLSHSLAQQAQGSFDAVSLVMRGLVERVEHDGLSNPERLRGVMADRVASLPQIRGLAVLDDKGDWLLSAPAVGPQAPRADRDYFGWHRDHADRQLNIGAAIVSRLDGHTVIPVTMRIDHADGSFAGVVRASLVPEYFQHFYEHLGIGERGIVALDSTAGRILARAPANPALVARDISDQPLFRDELPKRAAGVYWAPSVTDSSWLIAGYDTVPGWPLLVFVAKNADEVLAPWWREATGEVLVLLLASAVLLVIGDRVSRQAEGLSAAKRAAEQARMEADGAREAAERADQAKSEFLATMSHEVRTPLNGVLGFANLLLARPDLDAEVRRQLGFIASSGTVLLTVVNDVLTYAAAEGGHLQLDLQPFSPAAVADEVVAIMQHAAEAKGVALHCEVGASPTRLVGDARRLRQVLHNLVGNAVKFTGHGAVTLDVRCRPAGVDRVELLVSVTDTGIGIAPDKLDRLFKRFSQVDASVKRRFGGAGLGLAISKRLLEAMGGEIGVRSAPDVGSTFWFSLPLPVAAPQMPSSAHGTGPSLSQVRSLCILLAEDYEVNREIARAILTGAGHAVDVVGDGAAAVQAASAVRYDLILMDVQMPVMDGVEATRLIRAGTGASRATPIIALTANVLPDQIAAFLAAGMDAHLGKPFDPDELVAVAAGCSAPRVAKAA